jgi:hypothetical protein
MIQHFEVGEAVYTGDFAWRAAEHKCFAAWQWTANGFVGFATHDQNLAHRRLFKPFEIVWKMPRNDALITNDAVFRHSCDRFESFHGKSVEVGD